MGKTNIVFAVLDFALGAINAYFFFSKGETKNLYAALFMFAYTVYFVYKAHLEKETW